ncbi:SseB family protein [Marimonas lutisalis]|uniref:SseB family protein n=1 Tax=Marimonas lutisalis TaxID=2545756 RepID=UPI0010F9A6A8|nr:SseB family protein [Marimonas lutisalis]
MSLLDDAHAAMAAAPGDDAARLRFYAALADCELFLLLAGEAGADAVEPALFDTGEGRFVLVFDAEERLADFTGRPAPYAGLSGRALAGMLAGQGIGMALNPEVAPSSMLLPADAIDWLAGTLAPGPEEAALQAREIRAPDLPGAVIAAVDARLARAGGLAQTAYLVGITYADGSTGHLLAVIGAVPSAQAALAKAIGEAVVFSGAEAAALDVGFFASDDTIIGALARSGLRFDLPEPETPSEPRPVAPGLDPDKPPILK